MSYARYLREILAPMGVYDLDATFNGGELDSEGTALDTLWEELEEIGRESCLLTAEDWGLEQIAVLLSRRPVAADKGSMAAALAALLRIGGDSFTLSAINDTLSGCGIPAVAREDGVGRVTVSFPGIPGVPSEFEALRKIIEDILPAHLEITYWFWYLTWEELERILPTWQDIEQRNLTWGELEICMQ